MFENSLIDLDKKTKRGFLLTQDGLPGSVRAGLSLSGTRGNYKPPSNLRRLRELQDAASVTCKSRKKPGESDEALERLMCGRTTFMITHRLNTLATCHVRLEIEGGRLISPAPVGVMPTGEE